jgi:hypothetical protein
MMHLLPIITIKGRARMPHRIQDLENISRDDVNAAFSRNDPAELQFVSITLALTFSDSAFVQEVCIRLSAHSDRKVRGNAVTSLGYLARRFRKLDKHLVKPVIESALLDSDDTVRELAKSAADEIHQFLHWDIAGHVYG